MRLKNLFLSAAFSLASFLAVSAKDTPGVITTVGGEKIECADIDTRIFGKDLKYKLVSGGDRIELAQDKIDFFQLYYSDAPTELGTKWRCFYVMDDSKWVKGENKISKSKMGWAQCLVDAPTSLYLIIISNYNPNTGTTYQYKYYIHRDEWDYAVEIPAISKLKKKAVVAFFTKLFQNNKTMLNQLNAKGYEFIESFFAHRIKTGDSNGLSTLILEYNNTVDKK
ncbi:MAG: hypothetical protein MJZ19_03170 [Paludibacteraceae bacterium]|nr:hypothetical protein [Paludibacteraceae bacterium]